MSDSPRGSEAGPPDEEGAGSGVRTFLIADVRGYTHFTQAHGDEAAAQLAGAFASTTRAVAARCGGAVIELRGDEALVVFASARQALRAAVELQEEFAGGSGDAPALPLGVGIGVDAGEAVPLEQGYRGGALNLAARLCANARAGEVLASEGVTHLSGRVQGLEFRDPVWLRVKGLPRPMGAYQVVREGAARVKRRRRPAEVSARRRWKWIAVTGALVAAAAGALVFALGQSDSPHTLARIDASSAGAIDPRNNRLVDQVRVGAGPGRMATGFRSLWVVNDYDNTVSRIDPATGNAQVIQVDADPTAIAVGAGFVWVACSRTRSVIRIDPQLNRSVGRGEPVGNGPSGVAISPGAVWVTNRLDDTVTEIDSQSGKVRGTFDAGASPSDVTYGLGALWIANESSATVTRFDPGTHGLQDFTVGNGPEAVAVADGSVWVANSLDGTVSRVNPNSDVVTTFPVGRGPSSVLASDHSIWVADSYGARIVRIDPATSHILSRIPVGSGPQSLSAIGGRVWLSTRDTATVHRGGTLRLLNFDYGPSTLDPALSYVGLHWSELSVTGDGLVGLKRVGGVDGGTLVPDLATSLPEPTDGGRTYAFHLQRGIRYSNGDPVRASDVRRALERDFRVDSHGAGFYSALVGAAACSKERCDLSRGVITDDRTGSVTLQLRQPDPDFLYKLSLAFADPVPPEVSMTKGSRLGLPGTGPYVVQSFRHSQIVFVRNPHFRQWSAAAQPDGYPDRIVSTYHNSLDAQLNAVEHGTADLMVSGFPSSRLDEIATRYAAQLHVFPTSSTWGMFLNTRVPPFNNLAARRAVSFAIDRSKAVAGFGGVGGAAATCQILPVGTPGYRPYCPYTRNPTGRSVWTGPDLARALRLVAASGNLGQKVVFWTGPETFELVIGHLAVATLNRLGYQATLRVVQNDKRGNDRYFPTIKDSRTRAQAGFSVWLADYPAASNFFAPLFTCQSFQPASENNENTSEICNRHIDQAVNRALARQTTDAPRASNARWSAVDRLVTDLAPWVPLVNTREAVIASRRLGNLQANPQLGVLIDQLWVK